MLWYLLITVSTASSEEDSGDGDCGGDSHPAARYVAGSTGGRCVIDTMQEYCGDQCDPWEWALSDAERLGSVAVDCAPGSEVAHVASDSDYFGETLRWYDDSGTMLGYLRTGSTVCCDGRVASTFSAGESIGTCYAPAPPDELRRGRAEICTVPGGKSCATGSGPGRFGLLAGLGILFFRRGAALGVPRPATR